MGRDLSKFKRPDLAKLAFIKLNRYYNPLGFEARPISVDRDYKIQQAYYAQNREPLESVNFKRSLAGLPPIDEKENGHCVTWTLNSLHVINLDDDITSNDLAEAFDYGIFEIGTDVDMDGIMDFGKFKKGEYIDGDTAYETQLYLAGDAIIESVEGLYSGRWFKHPDLPHVQLRPTR